jgi:hypothetical protein
MLIEVEGYRVAIISVTAKLSKPKPLGVWWKESLFGELTPRKREIVGSLNT